jgi:hypothetical protein
VTVTSKSQYLLKVYSKREDASRSFKSASRVKGFPSTSHTNDCIFPSPKAVSAPDIEKLYFRSFILSRSTLISHVIVSVVSFDMIKILSSHSSVSCLDVNCIPTITSWSYIILLVKRYHFIVSFSSALLIITLCSDSVLFFKSGI